MTLYFWFWTPEIQINLLEIDEKSGDLRTRIPIDREALCGRRESPDCIFEAEIITKPQSLFKLFKVELEVEDLNDNAPIFPNSKIDINLSEETQLGSLIRLGKFTHIYQLFWPAQQDPIFTKVNQFLVGNKPILTKNDSF